MKRIVSLMLASFSFYVLFAQAPSSSPSPAPFSKAMESVLHDFTSNFRHISGDPVVDQPVTENYTSLVMLPGAQSCIITRYHSVEDSTASWQAIMYNNEDFQLASKQYNELYNRLKTCYLTLQDGSHILLKGNKETPKEESKFTVSSFRLNTTDTRFRDLKVDLEMLYQNNEWVIHINVVSQRNDKMNEATTAGNDN